MKLSPEEHGLSRRKFLATAVIGGLAAAGVAGIAISPANASSVVAAAADDTTEVPAPQGGAGIFDVDPDQGDISQDPNVIITGDLDALSEDEDL